MSKPENPLNVFYQRVRDFSRLVDVRNNTKSYNSYVEFILQNSKDFFEIIFAFALPLKPNAREVLSDLVCDIPLKKLKNLNSYTSSRVEIQQHAQDIYQILKKYEDAQVADCLYHLLPMVEPQLSQLPLFQQILKNVKLWFKSVVIPVYVRESGMETPQFEITETYASLLCQFGWKSFVPPSEKIQRQDHPMLLNVYPSQETITKCIDDIIEKHPNAVKGIQRQQQSNPTITPPQREIATQSESVQVPSKVEVPIITKEIIIPKFKTLEFEFEVPIADTDEVENVVDEIRRKLCCGFVFKDTDRAMEMIKELDKLIN
ncbi:hypothetical protein EIN_411350 [Entamoeba invadens IP1]|uniref:Uncharacterized protein n=1 Tax=Entamoeba invadens IP1 TaxID=370355 RepID=A0A0A1U157_ENTIV|nr:hypothetical protein EIN_411350 [Entamoeba invadens IP1]ELP87782.1 hypothetical protein EIN_411350 [Entamoeba invadens IP1]|eukprot:XP_004254553.1 hypothetical protein EIN_411350 [Entamoeba invadens IP1]